MFEGKEIAVGKVGCLQVTLGGDFCGSECSNLDIDFGWIDGDFAADVILDLGKLRQMDEEAVEVLREVWMRLEPKGARVLAWNVPSKIAPTLLAANLPFDIVTDIH